MNIERTLFWFNDKESLININDDFFGIGILLNRLLNEIYNGKKIKFINIEFNTEETYNLYPIMPKDSPYYYGGHLTYYGIFDLSEFNTLSIEGKTKYIWDKAYHYLTKSAEEMKNRDLLEAAKYAYNKGLKIGLNPDYRIVETDVIISGETIKAAVWINFKEDGMYSTFTLEKEGFIIFEKNIDKTKKGIEFFLEMYKAISFENNIFIVKGRKDVEYLPLKISLKENILK
ncbi:hypothetical protein ACX0HA_15410 [Flavobacterium hauense]